MSILEVESSPFKGVINNHVTTGNLYNLNDIKAVVKFSVIFEMVP